MRNSIIAGIIGVSIIGGAFYGGIAYAKSQRQDARGDFAGRFEGEAGNGEAGGGHAAGPRAGGFTAGEIISKDATGITIKMPDGSTKIVLVGSSAQISKSTSGVIDDLAIGAQVTVAGSANSDGSLTAESVQIHPPGMTPFEGRNRMNQ